MRMRDRYQLNKNASVGEKLICSSCGVVFVKTNYQQAFCKTKPRTQCKDRYWNTVTPSKRNNTTRISPANARYYADVIVPRQNERYYDDDQGWDAHKGTH